MKKILAFITTTLLIIACGDDNSTSPFEKSTSLSSKVSYSSDAVQSSSSTETNANSQRITWTQTREYSFIDTTHLRYYHLDHDCIYNESSKSFSWLTDRYLGIVDIDTLYPASKNSGHGSFGYKLSNDTLYECDYIDDKCDNMSLTMAASVYTGSSKSIFGTWNYVGRIYEGRFLKDEDNINVEMTITPTGTTEKIIYNIENTPLYYSTNFCGVLYDLFYEKFELENSCYDYFKRIEKHDGTFSLFNTETNTYEAIPDTVKFNENFWVTSSTSDEVIIFVENKIISVKFKQTFYNDPIILEQNAIVTYNNISCQKTVKQLNKLTKEICEEASIENSIINEEHSNITGRTEKILSTKLIDNKTEYKQCINQFFNP